jgi:hypothetical protein
MTAVIEISRGYTFDAWQFDCRGEQPAALHADADNPEANSVAGSSRLRLSRGKVGIQKHGAAGQGSSCNSGSRLQKLAAREERFTHCVSSAPSSF